MHDHGEEIDSSSAALGKKECSTAMVESIGNNSCLVTTRTIIHSSTGGEGKEGSITDSKKVIAMVESTGSHLGTYSCMMTMRRR